MRKLSIAVMFVLAGCQGAPLGLSDPKVVLADACQSAASALRPAIAARIAGKLGPSFITTIDQAGNVIDGFCAKGARPMIVRLADGTLQIDWAATINAVKNATASVLALDLGDS